MVKPDPDSCNNPRWQRRPTERRREILDAAVVVFGAEGYDGATIAAVAGRAGVSSGTVLNYFGSKEELFEAVLQARFLAGLVETEALIATHQGSYRDLLHLILTRKWRHLMERETADLVLVGLAKARTMPGATNLMCQDMGLRFRRLLSGVLSAGAAAGEFTVRNAELEARVMGSALAGLMLELTHFSRFDAARPDADALLAQYLELVDRALGVSGTPADRAEPDGSAAT